MRTAIDGSRRGMSRRRDDQIALDDLLYHRTYRRIMTYLSWLGPSPLAKLAANLGMNESKLEARLARLEAGGLVRKTEGRGTFYALTRKGLDELIAAASDKN